MANMQEIRERIKSINDIMKITNAMYLISSSKLKKAKKIWRQRNPILISCCMQCEAFCPERRKTSTCGTLISERRSSRKIEKGFIIVTADKGMCGSYNHNVIRLAEQEIANVNIVSCS